MGCSRAVCQATSGHHFSCGGARSGSTLSPGFGVQIGTSRSLKTDMTASVYAHGKYPEPGRAKVEGILKPGDWNKLRIEAKGNTFKIWLNGQHVVTYEDPAYPNPGPIGLQVHANVKMTVEFRNIKAGEIQ